MQTSRKLWNSKLLFRLMCQKCVWCSSMCQTTQLDVQKSPLKGRHKWTGWFVDDCDQHHRQEMKHPQSRYSATYQILHKVVESGPSAAKSTKSHDTDVVNICEQVGRSIGEFKCPTARVQYNLNWWPWQPKTQNSKSLKPWGRKPNQEKMDNGSSNRRCKNRLCMDTLGWLVTQKVGLAKLIILTSHVPGDATSHPLTAQLANGTLNPTVLGAEKIIKRPQNTKSFPQRATFWKKR